MPFQHMDECGRRLSLAEKPRWQVLFHEAVLGFINIWAMSLPNGNGGAPGRNQNEGPRNVQTFVRCSQIRTRWTIDRIRAVLLSALVCRFSVTGRACGLTRLYRVLLMACMVPIGSSKGHVYYPQWFVTTHVMTLGNEG